ncbi:unnamed protein product [Peronospora farinosa]|uniref:Uncharacterized protein n=1 Tax=Peronospora farinosa TaxID=134698 RepID=A0ABN8CB41_9STRA|nr:unnamed protein product [Peronospora farinosa]
MARGQAGGTQSSSARDMKMFLSNRMWYEHRYGLVRLRLSTRGSGLCIDLDRVFHSGEPWVVLCSGPDDVLPEVFDQVSPRLAGKSFVGVLDCKQKLQGLGKSVLKRYGIKRSISPTVFTVANGEKPKQVFLNHLQSPAALAKHVKARTKKIMQQVQNSAQLESRCLSRSSCVLFLRGQKLQPYEKQWIGKLMHKHRTLSFAWIDSTSLKLSLENMLPDVQRGEHRMVLFRRQRDSDTRKTVLAAKAYRGGAFDAVSLGTFLDNYAQGDPLKPLTKSPKVLHRKKKTRTSQSEQGDRENGHAKHQLYNRHKGHDAGEKKGDDYYFPQHVEQDEDGAMRSIEFDDVDGEENVLNLDDDEE